MNIVNTFTGARMNKDIDARLIPSTEYIDALNVDVINSTDGNKNGVLRNSKGNRRLETPTGVTIDVRTASGMPLTNPVVIGVCKYEPNNAIYWLIASDTEDTVVEYIDRPDTVSSVTAGLYGVVGDMTVILRSVKTTPTTPSLLGFNKSYLISGINYFNGFLLWTDNLSAPKMVNIADAKNWTNATTPFAWNIDDIIVIVKPPVSAPSLFLKNDTNIKTNTKNKFLYFSYRYKYANSRWSSMAPFSKVGFFPSAFAYDQNAEANVGMQNIYNSVDITVNTGSRQVTDIQILFRDTSSNNVYIIETINKAHPILQTSTILDDSTFTYKSFDNNKIYTALPSRQLTRLFDNVPIKALAQDIIGGRLIYGNYTQFYDLKTDFNSLVLPNYTVSINSTPITTAAPPQPSLKTGRDYEIGLMYLDDYGRMSTVLTSPKNTIHLPYSKAGNKNSLILDIAHFPPKWATKYRVAIKQSKDSYYNIYPRVAYLDGTGTWFKISNSDVNKIAAGDYVIIKTLYTGVSGDSKEYKVLEIAAKNFGEIVANTSLAGTYLKLNYTQAITSVPAYSFLSDILNSIFQGSAAQLGNAWLVGASKPNIHSSPCVLYRANGTSFKGASSGADYIKGNSPNKDIRYIVEYVGIISGNHCVNYREFPSQTNTNLNPVAIRNVSSGQQVPASLLSVSMPNVIVGTLKINQTHQLQVGDSWRVNVYSLFRGNTVSGGKINDLCGIVDSDSTKQEITGGTLIEFKIEDRTGSVATTTITPPQSFIATKTYVDIQEWFWEDGAYLTFNYLSANNVSLGYKNVFFRNALPSLTVYGAPYYMNHITAALPTTSNSIVYMLLSSGTSGAFGSNSSLSGYVYIKAKITYQKNVLCLETAPKDTDSKIFHECSEDFQIYQHANNRCHTGDIQNQTTMQHARLTLPLTFNCFAFDNGVESNRIRDDFNAPTMEWSPRVNGVSEDYGQQVQSESLTYSGVYRADSNVNNLNEFNLSIGNFKNLEKSFGSIQKIKSRDNDLIVIHEDKITKVLYGKNLLSDSTGGGTVSSVPEVLGTQISYEGNYGISRDPMTFTEYAGDMWFSDVQRGVLLRLNNQGLFPISKNGMQSFFNTRFAADFSTKKIGAFDPVNKRYMYTDTSIKITKQPNTIIINSAVVDAMGSSLSSFLNDPILISSNNNPIP